jgi:DNA-binding XRE family transcriptional regulator
MTLGQQVKENRKKMGWTQEILANRSGVSRFTIQAMERDRFEPSLRALLKVARELRACFTFSEGGTELVVADITALRKVVAETTRGRR